MGKFVDLDETAAQTMFEEAFKNALKSFPGITNPGSGGGGSGGGSGSQLSNSQGNSSAQISSSQQSQTFQSAGDIGLSALNKLPNALEGAVETYNGAVTSLKANTEGVLDQYNELHRVYGGITLEYDGMTGSSKAVIDRLKTMKNYYSNVGSAGIDMAKKVGFSSNIAASHFENEGKYFMEAEKVLSSLVEQHSKYISKIDDETLYKLPAYSKGLGVTTTDIAKVVETQIVMTGKAQTTILDDVARFAKGLHKSTGIPLKSISGNAIKIINDTKRLGNTTAEEATRIAATLGQLGQTYESLTGVMDKFQEFGGAADTAGLVSQITGGAVNLDAQQLMYLASEEQEKFLPELRRSLLEGGFDKEAFLSISRAEQRQLEQTLNLDYKQTLALLDRDREFNEADIAKIQEDTANKNENAAAILEENMGLAPKAFEDAAAQAEYFRQQGLIPLHDQLLLNAKAQSEYNSNVKDYVQLTDQAASQQASISGLKKVESVQKSAAQAMSQKRKIGVSELATETEQYGQNIVSNVNQSQATTVATPAPAAIVTPTPAAATPAQTNPAPAQQPANNQQNVQNNQLITVLNALNATMSQGVGSSTVQINLDGKKVGQAILAHTYGPKGAHIITSP